MFFDNLIDNPVPRIPCALSWRVYLLTYNKTNMKKRIFAGVTHENELYFLEVDTTNNQRNGYDEFAMSGFTVRPINREQAEAEARERLEDGELWRMAVEAERTYKGLSDWVEEVLAIDGIESTLDLSLYPEEVDIDGETYVFESCACGQHEEEELQHYAIPEETYKQLMKLWKQYHLEKNDGIELPGVKQLFEVEDAIRLINNPF